MNPNLSAAQFSTPATGPDSLSGPTGSSGMPAASGTSGMTGAGSGGDMGII